MGIKMPSWELGFSLLLNFKILQHLLFIILQTTVFLFIFSFTSAFFHFLLSLSLSLHPHQPFCLVSSPPHWWMKWWMPSFPSFFLSTRFRIKVSGRKYFDAAKLLLGVFLGLWVLLFSGSHLIRAPIYYPDVLLFAPFLKVSSLFIISSYFPFIRVLLLV